MGINANDTTTMLVVVRAIEGGDRGARMATAHMMIDALRAHPDITRCSSSVARDIETRSESGAPPVALIAVNAPVTAIAEVLDRVEATLDPAHDLLLEVDERQIVAAGRHGPPGSVTPGECMVSLVHRAPSLTREAFAAYWGDVHAPVAMSFTILPSTYTQYVTLRSLFGDTKEPDGVMIMHFRTAQDRVHRWASHPDEAARGAADAAVFMDLPHTASAVMQETVWR